MDVEFHHPSCPSLVISASNTTCVNGGKQEHHEEGKKDKEDIYVDVNNAAEISAELQRERQRNAELMDRISMLEAQLLEKDKDYSLLACGQDDGKAKRQKVATINTLKLEEEKDTKPISVKEKNAENRLVNWMNLDDTELSLHSEILKESDHSAADDTTDDDDDGEDEVDEEVVGENCVCSNKIPAEENVNPSTDDMSKCMENQKQEGSRNHHHDIRGPEIKFKQIVQNVSSHKKNPKIAFCPKEVKRIIDSEELLLKNAQSHTIRKIIVFASLGIRHGCEDLYELEFSHFTILRKGEPFVSSKDPGEHVLYENPGVRRKIFYPNRQNSTLCPVKILEEEKAMRPSDAASCPSFLFLCIKYGGRTRNIPQNEYVRQRMGRNKLKSFGLAICRMAMLVHIRSGSFFFKALGITLLFMAGFPDDLVQRETKYRNLDLLQKYYRTDEDAEGEELFLSRPATADPDAIRISQQIKEMAKKTSTKSNSLGQNKDAIRISQQIKEMVKKTSTKSKSLGQKDAIRISQQIKEMAKKTSTKSNSLGQNKDAIRISQQIKEMAKKTSTKSKSRGQKKVAIKDQEKASFLQSSPSSSGLPSKFKLLRNESIQSRGIAAAHCITSQEQVNHSIPNHVTTGINCNILNDSNQQYPIFSPHPIPIIFWPPPNTFLPYPHPSSHAYPIPYPISGNSLSSYPQPYYNHPSCNNTLIPNPFKESWKEDPAASVAGNNDSKSICSSSTEPKKG